MVKNPLLVRVRDMMRKRALLAGSNNLGDTMVPLGGVIMLALIGTAILLGLLSAQIERNADAYLHRVVNGALLRERAAVGDAVMASARWDDAVGHVYGDFDRQWAESNLATEVADSYVLDVRGRTIWSAAGSELPRRARRLPLDQALDLPVLHELMTALPQSHRAALDERKAVVRFVRLQGQAAILGVRAITPWKDVAHLPSGDVRYLVLTKPIDAKLLADMSRTNQLPLRWNVGTTGDTENGIRVKDVTGRVLGQVEWRRSSSGAKALRQIMPAVAIIVLTFLAMSGWLAWRRIGPCASRSSCRAMRKVKRAPPPNRPARRWCRLKRPGRRWPPAPIRSRRRNGDIRKNCGATVA